MKRGSGAGIVFAAGWLCSEHSHDDIAADLLEAAGLETIEKCQAVADRYDVGLAKPALQLLKDRRD
ncbi:hypothetical protein EN817_17490 [Mesorhizobium sp. M3A.F.Ca.ET.174.01.1.1]|uniref:hypothetical protein n=1 Tax=unclassified Mesorhizobium TaxID=325217 RepID=UPI001093B988|nr:MULTISPECIES: hypothetical protein [unclassified Mesorhizobium]TGS86695.1 hypothetical protein EN818_15345 [Mesorhizobium sp. M3A.F.Ca.ET.175.01.1.1]TGT25143.1 hypothetical protein EN817_17490 [Mesorhizobium sp. M3A.F.Ca.ET.174.01.1.1]